MTTRRRVREVVLQILYEDDINPHRPPHVSLDFLERRMRRNQPLIHFGKELLAGIRQHRAALDQCIGKHAANWSVKRMATIDRNILRLATYEMTVAQVPGPVAINEAVELAKRYGHHNSGSFVNGILDRIHRESQNGSLSCVSVDERAT